MADVRTVRIPIMYDDRTGPGRAQVQRGLRELQQASQRTTSTMRRQWETLRRHQLAAAAAITAAVVALRAAWENADMAAQYFEQRAAVEGLANQYEMTADAVIESTKRMARGLISTKDAADVAARSLALGFSPEQIGQLAQTAERFTDVIGGTAAEATNRLAKAIATQEVEMTKTLGLFVQTNKVMKEYAAQTGRTAQELSNAERTQAFFNEVMRQTGTIIDRLGPAFDTLKDKIDRAQIDIENLELKIHSVFTVRLPLAILATVKAMTLEINAIKLAVLTTVKIVQPLYEALGGNVEDLNSAIATAAGDFAQSIRDIQQAIDLLYSDLSKLPANTKDAVDRANESLQAVEIPEPIPDINESAYVERLARDQQFLDDEASAWAAFWRELQAMRDADTRAEQQRQDLLVQTGITAYSELFLGARGAAAAQAGINTYEAITKVLAQGGIFGPALAIPIAALGFRQVANILSTNLGSIPTAGGPVAAATPAVPTQEVFSPQVSIYVSGGLPSSRSDVDRFARQLLGSLDKARKDRL